MSTLDLVFWEDILLCNTKERSSYYSERRELNMMHNSRTASLLYAVHSAELCYKGLTARSEQVFNVYEEVI